MIGPLEPQAVRAALADAQDVIDVCAEHLAQHGGMDANQVVAYDLAHAAAAVSCALGAVEYGERGQTEGRLAAAFIAEAIHDVAGRLSGREEQWGVKPGVLDAALRAMAPAYAPEYLASLCGEQGDRHLDGDMAMVADTFRRFADEKLRPVAEHIHRTNGDVPEDVVRGIADLGAFGLSVPEAYGGWSTGGPDEYIAMVIATEELSRGSLACGGSLMTRPEILTRALVQGGTERQKLQWLPKLASGEALVAVAVTEPDFGSDSGAVMLSARPDGDDYVLNGVKTWCTFAARADVLMVLARTDPTPGLRHRGLSLFVVPKDPGDSHGFVLTQPEGGQLTGRPIDTIGYRGMHSYEVAFENWRVPASNLVGEQDGLGRGFYLWMAGIESGRLQTTGRALGVMQAAYEAALEYANNRVVFDRPLAEFQLTQVKLTRMAATIQSVRQFAYQVARVLAKGQRTPESSFVKAYACLAAEWITREAMQIHGGMGYAEEYAVSRYFVDARVLSIFEGADEVLALRVIARGLIEAVA